MDGNGDVESVDTFLLTLGLERYAKLFTKCEYDMDALRLSTKDDLKDVGLPLGPIIKILKAVKLLPPAQPAGDRGSDGSDVFEPVSGPPSEASMEPSLTMVLDDGTTVEPWNMDELMCPAPAPARPTAEMEFSAAVGGVGGGSEAPPSPSAQQPGQLSSDLAPDANEFTPGFPVSVSAPGGGNGAVASADRSTSGGNVVAESPSTGSAVTAGLQYQQQISPQGHAQLQRSPRSGMHANVMQQQQQRPQQPPQQPQPPQHPQQQSTPASQAAWLLQMQQIQHQQQLLFHHQQQMAAAAHQQQQMAAVHQHQQMAAAVQARAAAMQIEQRMRYHVQQPVPQQQAIQLLQSRQAAGYNASGGPPKFGKEHPRYKTALCQEFEARGSCAFGVGCCFAHGTAELRAPNLTAAGGGGGGGVGGGVGGSWRNGMGPADPRYKTELCRDMVTLGRCAFGAGCCFAHGHGELRKGMPKSDGGTAGSMKDGWFPLVQDGADEVGGRGDGAAGSMMPSPSGTRWRNGIGPEDPRWRTELCKDMATAGACSYGENCCFAHGPEALQQGVAPACASALLTDEVGRSLVVAVPVTEKKSQAEQKQLRRALKQQQKDGGHSIAPGPENAADDDETNYDETDASDAAWQRETELIQQQQLQKAELAKAGDSSFMMAPSHLAAAGPDSIADAAGSTAREQREENRLEQRRSARKLDKLIKSLERHKALLPELAASHGLNLADPVVKSAMSDRKAALVLLRRLLLEQQEEQEQQEQEEAALPNGGPS